jgi:error-prone DNA polymerase
VTHGFCNVCAHDWIVKERAAQDAERVWRGTRNPTLEPVVGGGLESRPRFSSPDDLIAKTGLRRDELATLAEIGALESFGYDRRGALWQIERAARPAGALFEEDEKEQGVSPLRSMTSLERVAADYAGTGLTIGPHPMAFRRRELALRGVLRAIDLPRGRHGRRVRVAGAVITRQRPGTAKGFVFLTLEDETGIANIIVQPDLFVDQRLTIVNEPYVVVEGTLQIQDGVTSVKAERVLPLTGDGPSPESHDFY